MAGTIDIKKLSLEELSGVVGIYPWFALARKELCSAMDKIGGLTESQVSEAALYMADRRLMMPMISSDKQSEDCSDRGISQLVSMYVETSAPVADTRPRVAGADFFSTEDYAKVSRREDREIFSSLGRTEDTRERRSEGSVTDICTETLARIYQEQGYPEEAKAIYSKLILAYPEKSAYFATLIDTLE